MSEQDARPHFAEERRAKIAALVRERGRVRMADLIALVHVSEPTIRKDLSALERRHVLQRTHGGAIAITATHERTLADRDSRFPEAKRRIARACQRFIEDADSAFLDSGTTVQAIAAELGTSRVNILTNSLPVAQALADRADVRHTLLGGQLRTLGGSLVGPTTLDTLRQFRVDVAFIGVSGLTEDGVSVSDVAEGQVKRAVIDTARRVVVPIDASKFGTTDFYHVAALPQLDVVVTDHAPAEVRTWCDGAGVQLVVAD